MVGILIGVRAMEATEETDKADADISLQCRWGFN